MSGYGSYVTYGPNANCTIELCPIEASVYQYRPSVPANAVLVALFALSLIMYTFQSYKWRTWGTWAIMFGGYACELIGYGGRFMLYQNPFSFTGFLIQIICIAIGPVFFTAVIYTMISKIVIYLGRDAGRFSPALYYWIFIPCDILSLILQGTGGALSSLSAGGSKVAVDVSLAGLCFQVATLTIFCGLVADYTLRWRRMRQHLPTTEITRKFKIFCVFLALSTILILVRCCYRIDELSDGYSGPLIHNQGLFIGLEGVVIVIAVLCLNVAHPGPIFGRSGETSEYKEGADGMRAQSDRHMHEAKSSV